MKTHKILPAGFLFISMICGLSLSGHAETKSLGQHQQAPPEKNLDQAKINPLNATAFLKPSEIEPGQVLELEIKLNLSKGFKAYEDQFRVDLPAEEAFKIANFNISPIHEFYDDFTKKNRRGVIDEATLKAAVRVPDFATSQKSLNVTVTYQACTKTFCLFPKKINLEVPFIWKKSVLAKETDLTTPKSGASLLSGKFEDVFNQGLLWTFIFVFLAGVLTSFTPCIFPMIPITLAVLSKDAHTRTRMQSFGVSLLYVAGIAITYAILGLLAASTGALFGSALSSPWVLGTICAVFLIMSLSLFGFYELQAPLFIRQRFSGGPGVKGPAGAFLTGAFSGIVASPCVGPVLVGILAYVAQTQDLFLGFWLLFVFALGMGQIFIVLGLSTTLTKKLPRSGPWLEAVKQTSGLLMLGVFYYYLSLLLPMRYFDIALAVGIIAVGSLGGAFLPPATNTFTRLRKGFGMAAILFGAFLFVVGVFNLRPVLSTTSISGAGLLNEDGKKNELPWKELTPAALGEARKAGKPILIDFFAEWCAACHELDRHTFSQERVQALAGNFTLFRFDATNDSADLAQFKKDFGILGLPWVVFIDKDGNFRKDLTLTEFEEPVKFVSRMQKAL